MEEQVLLTTKQTCKKVHLSQSALWRAVRDGRLPAPIKLGARTARFLLSEIEACIAAAADARRNRHE